MRYPIFIEPGDKKHAFGVVVPDLPGCFSAGDTLNEALDGAKEAIAVWIESQLDAGQAAPQATSIDAHFAEYPGWIPSVIDLDLDELLGESERINISLPKRVIRRLDAQAERAHLNRSAYIAKLAMLSDVQGRPDTLQDAVDRAYRNLDEIAERFRAQIMTSTDKTLANLDEIDRSLGQGPRATRRTHRKA